jgi:transposase
MNVVRFLPRSERPTAAGRDVGQTVQQPLKSDWPRLSNEAWRLISQYLPSERGRPCRPASDNRVCFEGLLWIAASGRCWRHLPPRFGKWNSVHRRYKRWSANGAFDTMLRELALSASPRGPDQPGDHQALHALSLVASILHQLDRSGSSIPAGTRRDAGKR